MPTHAKIGRRLTMTMTIRAPMPPRYQTTYGSSIASRGTASDSALGTMTVVPNAMSAAASGIRSDDARGANPGAAGVTSSSSGSRLPHSSATPVVTT